VLFGQSSGPAPEIDPQLLQVKGSVFLTRPTIFHYTLSTADFVRRASDVLGWVADGSLKVTIGESFALTDAAEAHRALESRRTVGKVVLVP
jgi:NADPH2:quinone reductase